MFNSRPRATAWVRLCTPSLPYRLRVCDLTVGSEITNRRPISALVRQPGAVAAMAQRRLARPKSGLTLRLCRFDNGNDRPVGVGARGPGESGHLLNGPSGDS